MKVIGITGGVGAGKTQVLEYLNNKYGATICQTDLVAKKMQKKGGECFDAIVEHFGESILNEKGELDRDRLAGIIFNDPEELEAMNAIVHPAVKDEIRKKIAHEERKHTNVFIVESALLIEDSYDEFCDELWYIYAAPEVRRERLRASRGYSDEKISAVFASQLTDEEFRKHCQRVIDNSGSIEAACEQIRGFCMENRMDSL